MKNRNTFLPPARPIASARADIHSLRPFHFEANNSKKVLIIERLDRVKVSALWVRARIQLWVQTQARNQSCEHLNLEYNFYANTKSKRMTLNIKLKKEKKKSYNITSKTQMMPEPESIDKSMRAHKMDCDWTECSCTVDLDWYVRFSFAKILTRSQNGNEATSTTLLPMLLFSQNMIGLLFNEQ